MIERKELRKVIYEKDDNIATVTLNYPEKLKEADKLARNLATLSRAS